MLADINRFESPDLALIPTALDPAWDVLGRYLRRHLWDWRLPHDPAKVQETEEGLSALWRASNRTPSWTARFELLVFVGVGHQPPTASSNPLGIDFAEVAWRFFLANPMP